MYKFTQNTILFLRFSFIFGIVIAATFSLIQGKDLLLYGYLQGGAGLVALICSRGAVFILQKKIERWAPGSWADLTHEVYENIPISLKLLISFQYISLFYIAFVFGWYVFSITYFWMK